MEGEPQSLDHESLAQAPLKRKPDLVDTEEGRDGRTEKQQRPDVPFGDCVDASQVEKKEAANQNGNAVKEKGRAVLSAADKGKGKMVVVEAGDSDDEGGRKFRVPRDDEDGSSEDEIDGATGGGDDDDDSDFSDDSFTELDLDNILSVRTRRRKPLEPGAYLVEGMGDDGIGDDGDDDDGDDDEGDGDDDGDDDDDDDDDDDVDGDDDDDDDSDDGGGDGDTGPVAADDDGNEKEEESKKVGTEE